MTHEHVGSRTSRAIFIAFVVNLGLALVELIFGSLFHSSAIIADAIHDLGDALAIGLSYYFENYSQKSSDHEYTLGYLRFSLLGAMLTSLILIGGSLAIIIENVGKLFAPQPVNEQGMLILGIIAIIVNSLASKVLHKEHSEQESMLSLHFLEDILGWLAVIVVSVVLRFTDWYFLDPLLSLVIAVFILIKALPRFLKHLHVFLEKRPASLAIAPLKEEMLAIPGLVAVNQLNIWSIDGHHHVAMTHIQVAAGCDEALVRDQVHHLFQQHQIIESAVECDQSSFEHSHHCQDVKK
ncbi:cation diffusion facilitator family transporter [Streptococcus halichoeri]|uniref:cation diffusion facilitator family transporter n=1 Tax=Streptococcus halichoeri TaxID=254785 RepID=UPI000DB314E7|nr:cation diffusion facilitator family transporter [Streptococcus halichoeri]PZO95659.1 MAG: cation transporter [Streptococcus pyogenes]